VYDLNILQQPCVTILLSKVAPLVDVSSRESSLAQEQNFRLTFDTSFKQKSKKAPANKSCMRIML